MHGIYAILLPMQYAYGRMLEEIDRQSDGNGVPFDALHRCVAVSICAVWLFALTALGVCPETEAAFLAEAFAAG